MSSYANAKKEVLRLPCFFSRIVCKHLTPPSNPLKTHNPAEYITEPPEFPIQQIERQICRNLFSAHLSPGHSPQNIPETIYLTVHP